jgi:hypothetical protein
MAQIWSRQLYKGDNGLLLCGVSATWHQFRNESGQAKAGLCREQGWVILWFSTICHVQGPARPLAFVPYVANVQQCSTE